MTLNAIERGSWYSHDEQASLEAITRIMHDPPPTASVAGWLYPGSTCTVFGEPDSGKSMLLAASTYRIIRDGGEVLWVDYEMGEPRVVRRLLAFGLTPQEIAKNVRRVHYPSGPPPLELVDAYKGIDAAFFDGFTGLLGAYQGSSNSDTDVDNVYTSILRPLAATNTSVLSLDHVTKDRENRGRWAIGSQRKIGAPDSAYVFDVVSKFKPGYGGKARLKSSRDRDGVLDVIEFTLNGDLTWILQDCSSTGSAHTRYTGFMERISIYLEGSPIAISGAHIERDIKGANGPRRAALKTLIDEGYVRAVPAARNAMEHTSTRPYRESTDNATPPSSPELASSSPQARSSSARLLASPYVVGRATPAGELNSNGKHENDPARLTDEEPPEFTFTNTDEYEWGESE